MKSQAALGIALLATATAGCGTTDPGVGVHPRYYAPGSPDVELPGHLREPASVPKASEEPAERADPGPGDGSSVGVSPSPADEAARRAETEAPWRTVPFKGGVSSDTLNLKNGERGYRLERTVLQASARTALHCFHGSGPYHGLTLRDVLITVEPGTLPLDRSYWAFRGYDMIDTLLERVEITGFGKVTPKHDEGHAIYLNLAGDFTLRDSNLHHNGGQGLQLVNRPKESNLAPGPAAGTIRIEDTRFSENGFNPDRGGFQVSIFGTGQDILIRNVLIEAGQDDTVYPGDRTNGGLVIECEGYDGRRPVWWRPESLPEDFVVPFTQGRVVLENVTVRYRDPNRAIVTIKGCRELVVKNCTFEGGQIELDPPAKPGRASGRIEWTGNAGEVEVRVDGRRTGLANQDFLIVR